MRRICTYKDAESTALNTVQITCPTETLELDDADFVAESAEI